MTVQQKVLALSPAPSSTAELLVKRSSIGSSTATTASSPAAPSVSKIEATSSPKSTLQTDGLQTDKKVNGDEEQNETPSNSHPLLGSVGREGSVDSYAEVSSADETLEPLTPATCNNTNLLAEVSSEIISELLLLRRNEGIPDTLVGQHLLITLPSPNQSLSASQPNSPPPSQQIAPKDTTKRQNQEGLDASVFRGKQIFESAAHPCGLSEFVGKEVLSNSANVDHVLVVNGGTHRHMARRNRHMFNRHLLDTLLEANRDMRCGCEETVAKLEAADALVECMGTKYGPSGPYLTMMRHVDIHNNVASQPIGVSFLSVLFDSSVGATSDQSSFAILYHLVNQTTPKLKDFLLLDPAMAAKDYQLLKTGARVELERDYNALSDLMDTVGLAGGQQGETEGKQQQLWKALAAILHIGQIQFVKQGGSKGGTSGSSGGGKGSGKGKGATTSAANNADKSSSSSPTVEVSNLDCVWKAEKLLGISGENGGQVAALFTHCTSAVDGARVRRSVVNRLYERVFNNLVAHINQQLKVRQSKLDYGRLYTVSLVEAPVGFTRQSESVGALQSNFLQDLFVGVMNEVLLLQKQALYMEEGLQWTPVNFNCPKDRLRLVGGLSGVVPSNLTTDNTAAAGAKEPSTTGSHLNKGKHHNSNNNINRLGHNLNKSNITQTSDSKQKPPKNSIMDLFQAQRLKSAEEQLTGANMVKLIMDSCSGSEHLKKKGGPTGNNSNNTNNNNSSKWANSSTPEADKSSSAALGNQFTVSHVFGECMYNAEEILNSFNSLSSQSEAKVTDMLGGITNELAKSPLEKDEDGAQVLYQNAAKVQQKGDTVMTTVQKYAQYLMDLCCSHRVQAFFMFSIYPTRSGRASQEKQLNGGTGSGSAVDLSTNSKFLTMTLRALNVSPLTQVSQKGYCLSMGYSSFLRRYKMLTQYTWPAFNGKSDLHGILLMLYMLGLQDTCELGKRMIHVQSIETLAQLEHMRATMLPAVIKFLQKMWRGAIARQRYKIFYAMFKIVRKFRAWKFKIYLLTLIRRFSGVREMQDFGKSLDWPEAPFILRKFHVKLHNTFRRWRLRQRLKSITIEEWPEIKCKIAALDVVGNKRDLGLNRRWQANYLADTQENSRAVVFVASVNNIMHKNHSGALIFSSFIRKMSTRGKTVERAIVFTEHTVYKLDPRRDFKLLKAIELDEICEVVVTDGEDQLVVLRTTDNYDVAITLENNKDENRVPELLGALRLNAKVQQRKVQGTNAVHHHNTSYSNADPTNSGYGEDDEPLRFTVTKPPIECMINSSKHTIHVEVLENKHSPGSGGGAGSSEDGSKDGGLLSHSVTDAKFRKESGSKKIIMEYMAPPAKKVAAKLAKNNKAAQPTGAGAKTGQGIKMQDKGGKGGFVGEGVKRSERSVIKVEEVVSPLGSEDANESSTLL